MAYFNAEEIRIFLTSTSNKSTEIEYRNKNYDKFGITISNSCDETEFVKYECNECKKSLLSNHLLSNHVAENHDAFFDLQKERKPSFACFLEECKFLSRSQEERKEHSIKDHSFPHNFDYNISTSTNKSNEIKNDSLSSSSSGIRKNLINFHFGSRAQKFKTRPSKKFVELKELSEVLNQIDDK